MKQLDDCSEGELRDFYVVPILESDTAPQKALAFVRLDARDGAFQGISTLSSTFVYRASDQPGRQFKR